MKWKKENKNFTSQNDDDDDDGTWVFCLLLILCSFHAQWVCLASYLFSCFFSLMPSLKLLYFHVARLQCFAGNICRWTLRLGFLFVAAYFVCVCVCHHHQASTARAQVLRYRWDRAPVESTLTALKRLRNIGADISNEKPHMYNSFSRSSTTDQRAQIEKRNKNSMK